MACSEYSAVFGQSAHGVEGGNHSVTPNPKFAFFLLPPTRNSHFLWGPRLALSVRGFNLFYGGAGFFATPSILMYVDGDRLFFPMHSDI